MGLDVYLYEQEPAEYALDRRLEAGEITEAEYEKESESLGDTWTSRDDVPSEKYPEHLFKKTYLRSSYNEGGFNHVAENLTGHDLYWVFGIKGVDDRLKTTKEALRTARTRAQKLVKEMIVAPGLAVTTVSPNEFIEGHGKGVDEAAAIRLTVEQIEADKKRKPFPFDAEDGSHWYSNRDGEYFMGKPLEVIAAIVGERFGKPATLLVHAQDNSWYVQAAEIVVEFIDHALTMKHPFISWSG